MCRRHEVWLHVDAAHGGAAAFSPRHRHLVAGLELADSVVCDAHKMMFVPALCAMVFYKDRNHRFTAFQQEAPYLFDPAAPDLAQYDTGLVNLECTKRAAAFGLWGIWAIFGPQLFADLVDITFDLAQQFHAMLDAADEFEPLHEPECNIVAFRYLPRKLRGAAAEKIDAFQLRLRRTVIESGEYYLVPNRIDGRSVPSDDDDESAHHGRRSPRPVRLSAAARQAPAGQARPLEQLLALLLGLLDRGDLLNVRPNLRLLHLFVEMGKLCGRLAVDCLLATHERSVPAY